MTRVFQTEHGSRGNCFAACLATILNMALSTVPDLRGLVDWPARLKTWLQENQIGNIKLIRGTPPKGLSIAHVKVLTGAIHAVVCDDGKIIHDPAGRPLAHPDNPVLFWTKIEVKNVH